jgi:hypothetical protein
VKKRVVGACLVAVAAIGPAAPACNAVLGIDGLQFVLDGGPDGGTGGSTSSATGGTGGAAPCTSPASCPAVPDGPCRMFGTVTCTKGVCGVSYAQGDAASQRYGSCQKNVCDQTGHVVAAVDDTNVYDDGNPCTVDACNNGVPGNNQQQVDTVCPTPAMGYCETDPNSNTPACLQCQPGVPSTCFTNMLCVKGKCVPNSCTNADLDNGETDVDCGGLSCLKCATNKTCKTNKDCASGVCSNLTCQAHSCMDHTQNYDETAQDCGGSCGPCADALGCAYPVDCVSAVCKANICQPPSCTDGVKNGTETGVDCGGTCPACPAP